MLEAAAHTRTHHGAESQLSRLTPSLLFTHRGHTRTGNTPRVRSRIKLACLLCSLLALLGAATVASAGVSGPADGTLAVRGGRGTFVLQQIQGSVIGRIDRGKLTIDDLDSVGSGPIVRGKYWVKVRGTTVIYGGKAIRFRILGGRFTVRIENSMGVELSVVGRGRVMLKGAGFEEFGLSDGDYSLNGGEFLPVPVERTWLQLKAPGKSRPTGP
jgi:hypothetical protein